MSCILYSHRNKCLILEGKSVSPEKLIYPWTIYLCQKHPSVLTYFCIFHQKPKMKENKKVNSLFLHLHISQSPSLCFKTVIVLLIYFFWLHWVFIALRGLSLVASRAILHCGGRLLIKVASLVAEQALGTWSSVVAARGLRSCGSQALGLGLNSGGIQASLLWGVWNLPRPEIKLVPPALACGFWSTVLSEKSQSLTLSQPFSSKHKDTVSLPQSTVLSLFHMVLCSAYKSAVNIIHSHPFLLWTMILCLLELSYHSTNLSYTLCSGKTGLWKTGT